ncbi:MAG: dihydrofolate reductase [Deltaproteobacteria bacterium]|jgi:dihydrofolate reductase|nr:dihydrofolate reductase [Deltaproteobacteria bacterium]
MTKITVIAAIAQNGVIGNKAQNDIPWRISEDFAHFKELTLGHPCIMGRITYDSIPSKFRPLPGRENIILTNNRNFRSEGITTFNEFQESIDYVNENKEEMVFITGGSTIYKMGLETADIFELTRIHKDMEGDIYFPDVDWNSWELVKQSNQQSIDKISGKPVEFSFQTYQRII